MDSRQVVARFEAERQALAMMDHPHIAKVHDGGTTPAGRPYFVMELVKGTPITDYCDKHRLTNRERLTLFLDVCQAVQHAHRKGIIHRDLKPSNIMVSVHDVRPVVKVIDFGVAKAIGQQQTGHSIYTGFAQLIGTPLYMSPEQAGLSDLDVDTRSDVYALGVLLYELLTGLTPFDQERLKHSGFDELRRIIREEEPPKPSTRLSTLEQAARSTICERHSVEPHELAQQVRGELDWIVMKALEKDRDRRYESASAFAADVQCYLNDEAVAACPPSAGYRLRKYVRRNRRLLATAGVVAVALLSATVVSTWQAVRARDAQRTAATEAAIARAVNDFLQDDVLGQVMSAPQSGGEFAGNPNLTVREAIDRAAARIGQSFQDQPVVEAAMRTAIGGAYNNLNEHQRAVRHLERAVALRQTHLGPDHPDTLASMTKLGNAYECVDRRPEAIDLYQRRLESRKATLGPDHPDTLMAADTIATFYYRAGQWDISVPLLEQALDKDRMILGPTHPNTRGVMVALANNYADVGRFQDSIALHEKAADGLNATNDPYSTNLLPFAQVCQRTGNLDRADQMLREGLQRYQKAEDSLGQRHAKAMALGWLALNLLLQERYADAERTAKECLALDQLDNYRRFYWMSVLGAALLGQKKHEDAEPLLLQGYEGMKQLESRCHAPDRRLLTDAGQRVVRYYEETNQPEKARQWRERLLEDHGKK
jgi:non-specific serine/threonine protein kinase/serine/threonine-protein kinase